jgi:hypothetical protein
VTTKQFAQHGRDPRVHCVTNYGCATEVLTSRLKMCCNSSSASGSSLNSSSSNGSTPSHSAQLESVERGDTSAALYTSLQVYDFQQQAKHIVASISCSTCWSTVAVDESALAYTHRQCTHIHMHTYLALSLLVLLANARGQSPSSALFRLVSVLTGAVVSLAVSRSQQSLSSSQNETVANISTVKSQRARSADMLKT